MTAHKPQIKGNIVDAKDLRYVLRIFSKNWYIVAVALAISGVLSYLYTYKLPDIYGASTSILLKEKTTYDYQTSVYKDIGYMGSYVDMVNQQRVITSYDLLSDVLGRLDFDVSYFIVGRFKTSQVHNTRPFTIKADVINNRLYEKPLDLRLIDLKTYELSYERRGEVVRKVFPIGERVADTDLHITLTLPYHVNESNIGTLTETDYQIVLHNRDAMVGKYKTNLTVENTNFTSILKISLNDEVQERAKMFLDTLSKVYIQYTLQSEINVNENTIRYIDLQLDEVTKILEEYEAELQNFKDERQILDLGREEGSYFREMTNFDNERRKLELKLKTLDDLEYYVRNIEDEVLLPPSVYIVEDGYLAQALQTLYNQQMAINTKLSMATANNVAIRDAQELMLRIKGNLFTYIGNLRSALQNRVMDVEGEIRDYEGLIREVPDSKRGILNIKRHVSVNEKMYLFLLEKRATTTISRAGIIPTTKVLEVARNLGVVAPDKNKILYTFLLGGLLASMVVVFVRIMFYDRIENADQLKEIIQMPIYGEIIASDKAEENYIVVDSDPKAAITESFRTVRTNLEYAPGQEGKGKVVLVTSYRPNEGKTFCSANLSTILAKAGKKVLLLEMDLHKPKVGVGLGMSSPTGLSNVLIGRMHWRDAVMPTQYENFSVMLAGPAPPNASELVLSKHLEELFVEARDEYDYILIDTPPVGLITDALLMMRHADVTLFVVNTRFANKDHVMNAVESLQGGAAKNVGFILNGVRMKKSKYYYNTNYGYGYRYAYGYGSGSGYGYGYGYGRRSKGKKKDGDGEAARKA
jgi:capsular exopolysaccharide synthesis family protein